MRISGKAWWIQMFQDSPEHIDDRILWSQVEEDTAHGNVSLIRKLYNHRTLDNIGAIRVTANLEDVFGSVNYEKLGANSSVLVLNQHNQIVYASSGTGDFRRYTPFSKQWQEEHLMIEQAIEGLNWRIVALVPNEDLEQGASRVKILTVVASIISILVVVVMSLLISNYFSKRVSKLITSLREFKEGRLDKRIRYTGNDEFAHIAEAFNEMAVNMDSLIQEVYLANLEKKEAELESLQAQINPHFLYNTLSSISRLGKFGAFEEQDQIVKGLARFYRLTLNQGKTIIPVVKELEQAQAYLEIQKIKYKDRFHILYDIHTDIYGCDTIKLILQPFLENILEHALFRDPIHIRLSVYQEGDQVIFKIIDDGVGIKPEIMRQLNNKSGVQLGYGIRNVDERIKLHFGKQYGVQIQSKIGIGTTIKISIPIFKESVL
jgi:two-component system sensor histidine kinase YesM